MKRQFLVRLKWGTYWFSFWVFWKSVNQQKTFYQKQEFIKSTQYGFVLGKHLWIVFKISNLAK